MNEIIIKEFEGHQVEVIEFNGQILFNPYHVGSCLDLTDSAVRKAIKNMNTNQAIKLRNSDVKDIHIRKLNNAGENFLIESGVYKLVFKSNKPDAEKFTDWITDEVLPSIRKYGTYMTGETISKALSDPDFIIELATKLKEERIINEELEKQNKEQIEVIKELKVKADYVDLVLQNKSLMTITQIAKDYGMSGEKLNKKLYEMKIQYKQNKQWLLYSNYQNYGYTHSETLETKSNSGKIHIVISTKWTQEGRLFLYEKLKKQGILPSIERTKEKKSA